MLIGMYRTRRLKFILTSIQQPLAKPHLLLGILLRQCQGGKLLFTHGCGLHGGHRKVADVELPLPLAVLGLHVFEDEEEGAAFDVQGLDLHPLFNHLHLWRLFTECRLDTFFRGAVGAGQHIVEGQIADPEVRVLVVAMHELQERPVCAKNEGWGIADEGRGIGYEGWI